MKRKKRFNKWADWWERNSRYLMKPNAWEFVRDADGTYSVFHRGELLREGIPERWFDREVCVRWGFCLSELVEIRRQIDQSGRATVTL